MSPREPSEELSLKKIAFVAMPFGTKSTGIELGAGPANIDFDALYEKAIEPALSDLNYLPIRADNQAGSVIVKDMLEQLVHADLVLADVTIPNGNVYYEAGVRHAARATGCILMCAEWSKLLFDVAQLRQVRYPFPVGAPTETAYMKVGGVLREAIERHADAVGPVFELTRIGDDGAQGSGVLKESFRGVFEFQTRLNCARSAAARNDKAALRALISEQTVAQLPAYALRELTVAVREWLSWGELLTLTKMLPKRTLADPFFREQQAYALARQGELDEAVGLLKTVIASHGPTPERYRVLGDRYTDMLNVERNRQKQRVQQNSAVEAYRNGMKLDLNGFLSARSLLVALVARARKEDFVEAARCATLVGYAVERAETLNPNSQELYETRAVLAFFEQALDKAKQEVQSVLDLDSNSYTRVRLVEDLRAIVRGMGKDQQAEFEGVIDELMESLPIPQRVLMDRVLPIIKKSRQHYRKFQQVHARPAKDGEVVVSTTSDGDETTKMASAGDFVVKNLTEAQEQYIVAEEKFLKRYEFVKDLEGSWKLYDPVGEVLAIEITRDLTIDLNVGEEFYIVAAWGSDQLAREGDMFVSTLPDLGEVYRIARKEFYETYRLMEQSA